MIAEYFKKLRFDKNHHLGLGDIRLTIAQQDEIIQLVEGAKMKKYKARTFGQVECYWYRIDIDKRAEITATWDWKTRYSAKRAAERIAKKLNIKLEWEK